MYKCTCMCAYVVATHKWAHKFCCRMTAYALKLESTFSRFFTHTRTHGVHNALYIFMCVGVFCGCGCGCMI